MGTLSDWCYSGFTVFSVIRVHVCVLSQTPELNRKPWRTLNKFLCGLGRLLDASDHPAQWSNSKIVAWIVEAEPYSSLMLMRSFIMKLFGITSG